jgi:hypothetical protein
MPVIHHGTPGGSLHDTGDRYGVAGKVGEYFERRVGAALDEWLRRRQEIVHVFHDLNNLSVPDFDLGTTNIDHVVLTGAGWIMIDAKGVGRGQLKVENGRGVLVPPRGVVRPQPWMDDGRGMSRAGILFKLTGLEGVRVWVFPEGVDYTHPSLQRARCFAHPRPAVGEPPPPGDPVLTIHELAAGELEGLDELPVPYRPAPPQAIDVLCAHTNCNGRCGELTTKPR